MKLRTALAGGLAGAATLNLIHETYRHFDKDAPLIHLIGEEALVKMLKAANLPKPSTKKELYQWTLALDVFSNTLYFSFIGAGKSKNVLKRGLVFGLTAGLVTVFTPQKFGLSNAPSARTTETKLLTILWYTLGGIAAGSVIKLLRKKKTFNTDPSVYGHSAQL